ncbi:MAG TPA: hypothetical protein VMW94_01360, partial [Actinomycetes bacterium]|nr:hypothetical protein [Actinomycetes bacterium]
VIWDPMSFDDPNEDAGWVIVHDKVSASKLRSEYGISVPVGDDDDEDGSWGGSGNRAGRMDTSEAVQKRAVGVDTLYILPGKHFFGPGEKDCVDFPTMWKVKTAGDYVLEEGPQDYWHGRLPVIWGRYWIIDKSPYGDSIGNDLRGLQATITRTGSGFSMANDTMAFPQKVWPVDAGEPDEQKNGIPGAIIESLAQRRDRDPYVLEGASVSPALVRWFEKMTTETGPFIAGVQPGGLAGGVPPNIEAAAALNMMKEADFDRLAPVANAAAQMALAWVEMTMSNIRQFEPDEVMVRMLGPGGASKARAWSSADIDDDFIWDIAEASVRPQSHAAMMQLALSMFQVGGIDRRELRKAVGRLDGQDVTFELREEALIAEENEQAITQGQITTPWSVIRVENAEIAIPGHSAAMLSPAVRSNPAALDALDRHIYDHMLAAREQAMAAAGPIGPEAGGAPAGEPQPGQDLQDESQMMQDSPI